MNLKRRPEPASGWVEKVGRIRETGKAPNRPARARIFVGIRLRKLHLLRGGKRSRWMEGGCWQSGGLGEYVEIRVERSSLLKDRAGGDLCRVGSVYL